MKQVNICKNLTDIIAFVAVIFAAAFILIEKEGFEATEKVTSYWQVKETETYIRVGIVFFVSALVNVLTRRIPTVGLLVSLLPVWISFSSFADELLTKRPTLYLLASLIHFAGALIFTVQWMMSEDNPIKSGKKSAITTLVTPVLCLAVSIFTKIRLGIAAIETVKLPVTMLLYGGIVCGFIGLFWSGKAKKASESNYLTIAWCSLAGILVNVAVILLRKLVGTMGW